MRAFKELGRPRPEFIVDMGMFIVRFQSPPADSRVIATADGSGAEGTPRLPAATGQQTDKGGMCCIPKRAISAGAHAAGQCFWAAAAIACVTLAARALRSAFDPSTVKVSTVFSS